MSHPPKVEECLSTIIDYCRSIKADETGAKNIDATDILWIIYQCDPSVEDYLYRTQTAIPLEGNTTIKLHYRPKDSAND